MPPSITDEQRLAIRRALAAKVPRETIARTVGVTVRQVAAVAAHMTMGTYDALPTSEPVQPDSQPTRWSPAGRADPLPRRTETVRADAATVSRTRSDAAPANRAGRRESPADAEGVPIGADVETEEPVRWSPLSSSLPNPHILVVGGSGFGKTYACSCLIAELMKQGVPSIVLDYAQGFVEASLPAHFLEYIELHEITASRSGIDLNPLQLLPSDTLGPVNVAQRVADTFQRVFPQLGVQQHAVLREAVLDVLGSAGIRQEHPSSWKREPPKFRLLHEHLMSLGENATGPNRRVLQTLTAHISTLFVFNTLRPGGQRLDWEQLVRSDRVTVVQLKGLEHSLSKIVTEFLLWSLIGYAEARGPSKMSAFVVLDEAHRLSFDEGSPVERLLREGRKFGLGIMLASQQPSDFGPIAFANTASKLVFQVDDDRGYVSRQLSRKTTTHNQGQVEKIITRLPRGTAYAVIGNEGRLVSIESFEDRALRWS